METDAEYQDLANMEVYLRFSLSGKKVTFPAVCIALLFLTEKNPSLFKFNPSTRMKHVTWCDSEILLT